MSGSKVGSGGLIAQISAAGLERKELGKDVPQARIGGARIPYRPADLAAIITLLRQRPPVQYLALEVEARGGLEFIGQSIGGLYLHDITDSNGSERELRGHLRKLKEKFDVITIDGRGLVLPPDVLWKYILGGKEPPVREFGKGAQVDYGEPKMNPGCVVIVNLVDPDSKALYMKLRMRYGSIFGSPFVGVVRT